MILSMELLAKLQLLSKKRHPRLGVARKRIRQNQLILSRCAIFRPATAEFRIILNSAVKVDENGADTRKHKGF
jgi:hypothetical protein